MIVYLIRHAQSEHNLLNDVRIFDPSITDLGREQCINASKKHNLAFNLLLASTSQRSLQTADLIFSDTPIHATDLLLECNTGVACNCRSELDLQKQRFPNIDFETYRVNPNAREITHADLAVRVNKFLNLLKSLKYNSVVCVTHANFIKAVVHQVTGVYNSTDVENCGIVTLNIQ